MGPEISTCIQGVQKTIENEMAGGTCLGTTELDIKTFTFQFYRGYFPSKFCILKYLNMSHLRVS